MEVVRLVAFVLCPSSRAIIVSHNVDVSGPRPRRKPVEGYILIFARLEQFGGLYLAQQHAARCGVAVVEGHRHTRPYLDGTAVADAGGQRGSASGPRREQQE